MRYVIPLTPEPQRFSIVLAGRELLLAGTDFFLWKRFGEMEQ